MNNKLNIRQTLLLYLKGMAMGTADSVPGVSGGTIAFISGIYDELLASIGAFTPSLLPMLIKKGGIAKVWKQVNGNFLVVLGAGILSSLVLFAGLVVNLLETRYSYLMCFFSGLIIASVYFVGRQVPVWSTREGILLTAGAALSVLLSLLTPFSGLDNPLYYFCCGAVAICAMILPGISGAFILLLLGAYEPVLAALGNFELQTILVFAAGCGCGLLVFSRILAWLLRNHRAPALAMLLGILTGSLYTLWPWRNPVSSTMGPSFTDAVSGESLSVTLCFILAAGGLILVLALEQLGNKSKGKSNSSAS